MNCSPLIWSINVIHSTTISSAQLFAPTSSLSPPHFACSSTVVVSNPSASSRVEYHTPYVILSNLLHSLSATTQFGNFSIFEIAVMTLTRMTTFAWTASQCMTSHITSCQAPLITACSAPILDALSTSTPHTRASRSYSPCRGIVTGLKRISNRVNIDML